jgi:hypothetical protein
MRQFTADHLAALLGDFAPPCISLYQPTHRRHPENQQDPIRYRNLLRDIETSLQENDGAWDVSMLLEKFEALARDHDFWNHRTDGLAVLGSANTFEVFDLQRPVKELLVVADSFHVKPLLRILQSADRYQVLCLNRHRAKLYEGNRDVLDPMETPHVPATIIEALGEELTEPHQTVASYGDGSGSPRAPHGEPAMYHGQGAKKDEVEIDAVRFFRAVDRAVLKHHSRPTGLPLILAALAEHHAPFREVSHNPFLAADAIRRNPEALSNDELRSQAWRKVELLYLERLAKLVDGFQLARSRQLGSDDLAEVALAATAGRVGVLLVEANREVPGRIDRGTGRFEPGDLTYPKIDDALDDVAEAVLRAKGEVVVVPRERMPSDTGVAATYRF